MAAIDVPGWDSLSHTLISLEIGAALGIEVQPKALAKAASFGELVATVNRLAAQAR